jgi:hypothetical protein
MHYFEAFYKQYVRSPQVKIIKKITLVGVPTASSGIKLCFDLFKVKGLENELLYSNY